MKEILKHIYHWTTFHEGIQSMVHSYYVQNSRVSFLIDPRIPKPGLNWFDKHEPPRHIYLTNRLHYRHSADFVHYFNCKVWCHQAGLHHFNRQQHVIGFKNRERLPGGVIAINIDSLCPEETVLYIPLHGGILSIADSIIRERGKLIFVPDELLGDNPKQIKIAIKAQYKKLLRRKFQHLLFAHGQPIIGNGRESLMQFLAEPVY